MAAGFLPQFVRFLAELMSDRIPISIVTGFLGSGKTTLIAALLEQPAMQGTAIVVNEFGAVGIDDAVFAQTLDAGNLVLLRQRLLVLRSWRRSRVYNLGFGDATHFAAPHRDRDVRIGGARSFAPAAHLRSAA